MGYRIVRLKLFQSLTSSERALLDQVVAVATFQGLETFVEEPNDYPGEWELTIEGNSVYLNACTPIITDLIVQIASDIDPSDARLDCFAQSICMQLREQIVDWSEVDGIIVARPGRELEQRLVGEASFVGISAELTIHAARIREQLESYHSATGPEAWLRRHELVQRLRVDGIALIAAARRLRRIANDVRARLGTAHLDAALNDFDRKVAGLVALRDMAEHIDEYNIGRGRKDPVELEPGDVLELSVKRNDVEFTARGTTLRVLSIEQACTAMTACFEATAEHQAIVNLFPPLAEFQFTKDSGAGHEFVPISEESEEHSAFRSAVRETFGQAFALLAGQCETCRRPL